MDRRLLEFDPASAGFRRSEENPLACDLTYDPS